MRRRRKKSSGVILAFLLIVISITLIVIYWGSSRESGNTSLEEETLDEKEDKIKIMMVGDVLIHDRLYKAMRTSDGGYDFRPCLTYVKEMTKEYDIAYYNQETILGGSEIGLSSYPSFNSPYEVGDAMIDAGFNLVSLATNHTLDRGEEAIINSVNYWNSKDNVLAVGSYLSMDERNEIRIREANNITYTMLNYTYGTNGIKVPEGKSYLVNVWPCNGGDVSTDREYQEYKKTVLEDVKRVRDKVDLLIVSMHWGYEYGHVPNEYQIDMANYLESIGVDIIIGSHPHVVMPVTFINDTLVIYSLGNFLSAQETNVDYNTTVGLVSSITVTLKDGKISLSDLENDLVYTYSLNNKDYKVIPFSNHDIRNYLDDYERVYNKYADIVKKMDSNISVKALG